MEGSFAPFIFGAFRSTSICAKLCPDDCLSSLVPNLTSSSQSKEVSMATESTTPPNLTDENPQNPGSEPMKPMSGNGQDGKGESMKETSDNLVFVNSEPMREEQVENAVKFLSHPKVRGSPVIYRRSFLEKKGLTKEEIDEAFRRVPDPPPTVTSVQSATSNQEDELKSSTDLQAQVPAQTLQPAAAAPTGVVSTVATLPQSQFHWSHAFLAVGLIAASGAGSAMFFKNAVVPRLKSWIRKVVLEEEGDSVKKNNSEPNLAEEAAAAAKAAAAAAADVAKASQELLNSKNEEKKYFEAFMSLMDVQVEEMKSMSNAIKKLEATREVAFSLNKQTEEHAYSASQNGPTNTSWRIPSVDQEDSRHSLINSKLKVNGIVDYDSGSVRPLSTTASMDPPVPQHPKSYMEIMAMVQRGEKPPGIKEINDLPPNPNQPSSNPRLAPRVMPWEVSQAQNSSVYGLQSQASNGGSSSKEQDNRPTSQLNGYGSEPWWQRKNMRITEIESEDEPRTASYGAVAMTNEQAVQRVWVPPQPPPVSMPEAAAAIRQPKSLIQNEQSSNDQIMIRPSDEIDELQKVTKLSESGGELEINNESSNIHDNEIQEQEISIEGN